MMKNRFNGDVEYLISKPGMPMNYLATVYDVDTSNINAEIAFNDTGCMTAYIEQAIQSTVPEGLETNIAKLRDDNEYAVLLTDAEGDKKNVVFIRIF